MEAMVITARTLRVCCVASDEQEIQERPSSKAFQTLARRAQGIKARLTPNLNDCSGLGYLLTFAGNSVYVAASFEDAERYIDLLDVDRFIAEQQPRAKVA